MFVKQGIAVSPGVAIGPAILIGRNELQIPHRYLTGEVVDFEISRLHGALQHVCEEIAEQEKLATEQLGAQYAALKRGALQKLGWALSAFTKPWILSGFASALVAALCWTVAMTRLPLSSAYPFTLATFVLVMAAGIAVFGEPVTREKLVGSLLVLAGLALIASAPGSGST